MFRISETPHGAMACFEKKPLTVLFDGLSVQKRSAACEVFELATSNEESVDVHRTENPEQRE